MRVESSATLLLTVDEVEKIQRQKFVGVVTRVLQLTYAAMLDRLIQEEKLNRCHGCVIQHPSQREHSCLMMDREEAWLFYHDETRENIDVNDVLKTANNVCSLIGFKLSNSCETYVRELYKFLGLNSLSRLWNSKSLAREHKRNNWKTAFCMPLITVQTVSNPTIFVTWKFMKITTLKKLRMLTRWKCSALKVLSEKTKSQWTLILQLAKFKIGFLSKSCSRFVLKQKKCECDLMLDNSPFGVHVIQ